MTDVASSPRSVARYNRTAIVLHWVVAAFILLAIVAGLAGSNDKDPSQRQYIDLHKSLGITIFGLVVLRILWRWAHTPPPLPRTYSKPEQVASRVVHISLYVLMVALPISGYIHDSAFKAAASHPIMLYGLVHFPRLAFIKTLDPVTKEHVHDLVFTVHLYLGYLLYGLLTLHLLGVVKHHVVDHEAELQRMLPTGAPPPS